MATYTPEQYAAAGQFILANLNDNELIAERAEQMGLSINDLLIAAQTVNKGVTLAEVQQYLGKASPYVLSPETVRMYFLTNRDFPPYSTRFDDVVARYQRILGRSPIAAYVTADYPESELRTQNQIFYYTSEPAYPLPANFDALVRENARSLVQAAISSLFEQYVRPAYGIAGSSAFIDTSIVDRFTDFVVRERQSLVTVPVINEFITLANKEGTGPSTTPAQTQALIDKQRELTEISNQVGSLIAILLGRSITGEELNYWTTRVFASRDFDSNRLALGQRSKLEIAAYAADELAKRSPEETGRAQAYTAANNAVAIAMGLSDEVKARAAESQSLFAQVQTVDANAAAALKAAQANAQANAADIAAAKAVALTENAIQARALAATQASTSQLKSTMTKQADAIAVAATQAQSVAPASANAAIEETVQQGVENIIKSVYRSRLGIEPTAAQVDYYTNLTMTTAGGTVNESIVNQIIEGAKKTGVVPGTKIPVPVVVSPETAGAGNLAPLLLAAGAFLLLGG